MAYRILTGLLFASLLLPIAVQAQRADGPADAHSGAPFVVDNPLTSAAPASSSPKAQASHAQSRANNGKKNHPNPSKQANAPSKVGGRPRQSVPVKTAAKPHQPQNANKSGHTQAARQTDTRHASQPSNAAAKSNKPGQSAHSDHKSPAEMAAAAKHAAQEALHKKHLKILADKREAELRRRHEAHLERLRKKEARAAAAKAKAAGTVAAKAAGPGAAPDAVLAQTKPDGGSTAGRVATDHTVANPMVAVGDAWKMLAYLLPMLIFIVVCLNVLRRYHQQKGRLPFLQPKMDAAATAGKLGGLWSALIGSFHLNNAREAGGASIRVVESVPVGGVNLHLVQVRGRLLLLGATGAGVNVLTEFREQDGVESEDFGAMLHAAASDLDALDLGDSEPPVSAVVGSLQDAMRETGDSVERRLRRLRTVQETEEAVD